MNNNKKKLQKLEMSEIVEPAILCELSNVIIVLINCNARLYILETLFKVGLYIFKNVYAHKLSLKIIIV